MTHLDARVDAPALERLLADNAPIRVLDVRTPSEFESVHIPGSYNVPLDTLGEHAAELAHHLDEPLLLVCRSGNRADRACEQLAASGMPNLHVLVGGIQAWDDGRRSVRRGRRRWDLERQVRLVAGSLVLAGIVGSIWVPPLRYVSGAVGLGLTVAALSNTCAMGMLLARLPYNRGARAGTDVAAVVRELTTARSR
ncbi:MAG TPA: rhodanese-like domain-containing protein [Ilumatobacter sp.]|nr:rhodanese-like domain-containing protein [Ilumatobacter sp.]